MYLFVQKKNTYAPGICKSKYSGKNVISKGIYKCYFIHVTVLLVVAADTLGKFKQKVGICSYKSYYCSQYLKIIL